MEQVARKEKRAQASTTDAVLPSAGEAEPSTSKKAKRSLGSFFKSSAAVPPASTAVQLEGAIEADVNTYLMTRTIDGEEDPLAWWKLQVLLGWLMVNVGLGAGQSAGGGGSHEETVTFHCHYSSVLCSRSIRTVCTGMEYRAEGC
ncbi:hypothetical protein CgunFtcFv8_011114 [Champsocephalus gunnari]|uniref:Uncharacterized protein n=1 Tax=Champsocephalus gunnari TaxID=52237 RepID=A0AAN8E1S2_CHAGU|nr:hypothetical protein CgunFtcFv8_011114 [Champsocephalus gunnari]